MSGCTEFPTLYTGLQLDLRALLPADGSRISVQALADAAGISSDAVADALFDLYLAHTVDYDVLSDSFSLALPPAPKGSA